MGEISVLFAVEAEQLLLAEIYEEAIELCYSGLKVYPEYASAYGIIARAMKQLGRISEATETINKAVKLFPTNRLLKTIADDVENSPIDADPFADPFAEQVSAPVIQRMEEYDPNADYSPLPDPNKPKSDFDLDSLIGNAGMYNAIETSGEAAKLNEDFTSLFNQSSVKSNDELLAEIKSDDDFDYSAFSTKKTIENNEPVVESVVEEDDSAFDLDSFIASQQTEAVSEPAVEVVVEEDDSAFDLDSFIASQQTESVSEPVVEPVVETVIEEDDSAFDLDSFIASQQTESVTEPVVETVIEEDDSAFDLDSFIASQQTESVSEPVVEAVVEEDDSAFDLDSFIASQQTEAVTEPVVETVIEEDNSTFDLDSFIASQQTEAVSESVVETVIEEDNSAFDLDSFIASQQTEAVTEPVVETVIEEDNSAFDLDTLIASQLIEEVPETVAEEDSAFDLDSFISGQSDETEKIDEEEEEIADFDLDSFIDNQQIEAEVAKEISEELEDTDDDEEDNSVNEALLAELYNKIEKETEPVEIQGHLKTDDFLLNLQAKLDAANSEMPLLSPEEQALADAQVYDFSQSAYEDELGEVDDDIIIIPENKTNYEIDNSNEDEIPEHLLIYVGQKGFADKLRSSDTLFDRNVKARNLSIIPGLDNSPIREIRYIQKKIYDYQTLPQEPNFCVQAFVNKDSLSDFADLFGFKSFNESSMPIVKEEIKSDKPKINREKKELVTETIANIYVLQGAYQEAIKAYSDLADNDPSRAEYFENKIKDTIAKEEQTIIKD